MGPACDCYKYQTIKCGASLVMSSPFILPSSITNTLRVVDAGFGRREILNWHDSFKFCPICGKAGE